jgi:hypothetical protein
MRPVWRWKSFWLGVLVLVFLASSWAVSMTRYTGMRWVTPGWSVIAGINGGTFGVHYLDFAIEPPLGFRADGGPVVNERVFPQPILVTKEHRGVVIAHWLLIVLFLPVWGAFLDWRLGRMERVKNLTSIPG